MTEKEIELIRTIMILRAELHGARLRIAELETFKLAVKKWMAFREIKVEDLTGN